ncbi:hypothetical protein EV359DRAFT_80948 [Lentinula novae-zelandiae]|nr:hypothetical protein EV359DRAFT_80948 [Lentinula novae-zelandiae]
MRASIVFSDMDFELTIEDSDGQTIHKHRYQSVSDTVAWAGVLDDIETLNPKDSVLGLIRTVFFVEQEEGDEDDDKYQDVHWTPAMRAAASRILDDRHAARHVECNTNLSRATYNTLLQEYPSLKPMLLGTLRKHIFDAQTFNLSSTVYRSAAEMKKDHLISCNYSPTQEFSTLREKGLEIIEQGFCDLEERDSDRKFSKKPQQISGPEAQKRDAFIDRFQKIAIGNSCGDSLHEEFGAWDDRNVGVNSNDSDYEEEMNARQPDISCPFLVWATAICSSAWKD